MKTHRYHIGCVVVLKGKVLSTGHNSTKTHPIQKIYNIERFDSDDTPHMVHAEISALSHIVNKTINWNNVEVYTYRELNNGHIALSKPCRSCMALIKKLGIKTIHYTTYDGYATEYLTYGN